MSIRISHDVIRGLPLIVCVDGADVAGFEGETVATTLLGVGRVATRIDQSNNKRGFFCNMGTCSECFVTIRESGAHPRRVRACLTLIADGMTIETGIVHG